MTLEDLSRLETMHAEVHPAAPAEIYQWFPEMAKALREAREDAHKHREDALAWMQASFAYQRERDEARAALDQVSSDDRMSEAQIIATIRHAQAQKDEAIRQRDEALAKVERLRAALGVK